MLIIRLAAANTNEPLLFKDMSYPIQTIISRRNSVKWHMKLMYEWSKNILKMLNMMK